MFSTVYFLLRILVDEVLVITIFINKMYCFYEVMLKHLMLSSNFLKCNVVSFSQSYLVLFYSFSSQPKSKCYLCSKFEEKFKKHTINIYNNIRNYFGTYAYLHIYVHLYMFHKYCFMG